MSERQWPDGSRERPDPVKQRSADPGRVVNLGLGRLDIESGSWSGADTCVPRSTTPAAALVWRENRITDAARYLQLLLSGSPAPTAPRSIPLARQTHGNQDLAHRLTAPESDVQRDSVFASQDTRQPETRISEPLSEFYGAGNQRPNPNVGFPPIYVRS